jgi:hypothetical protein
MTVNKEVSHRRAPQVRDNQVLKRDQIKSVTRKIEFLGLELHN